MLYDVFVPITGYVQYQVVMDTEKDAVDIVREGDIDCHDVHWVEDTDTNNWEVEPNPVQMAGVKSEV